ncbi:hypothetical protein AgCh_024017 [Apium graveolens]
MARENGTCAYNIMTLFLFIVFFVVQVMPHQENTSQPPLPSNSGTPQSTYDVAKKSNLQNLTNPYRDGSAITRINKQEPTKQHNSPSKVQHKKAYRSSQNHQGSMWRDLAINASAHEVPSGPNPISNR